MRAQRYASEIGPKIQAFFEDYFQIPFPLPKQDMIAIPDFAAGLFISFNLFPLSEFNWDSLSFLGVQVRWKIGD